MSSSESDDDAFAGKKSNEKVSRASVSYQHLLTAKEKFSEMMKNQTNQSKILPVTKTALNNSQDYDFNPVASSTQIGTPNELKHITHKPLRKLKPSIVSKLVKPSRGSSSSSSEDDRNHSKKEVINISSTVPHGDSSSSESIEERKTNAKHKHLIKPITVNSSYSAIRQSESKNLSSEESTSNTDSESSKKLTHVKNKKSNRTSSSSERLSPEKKAKRAKLKRKSSISSEESSETDRESNKVHKVPKLISKKTREEHISSSEEDSLNERNSHKIKQTLVTKGQRKAFYQERSSYSGSESEDLSTSKPNNKAHLLKIIGKKPTNLKHTNPSFQEKRRRSTKTSDSSSSDEEDEPKKSNKKQLSNRSSSDSDSSNKHQKQHAIKSVQSGRLITKKKPSSSSSSENESASVKKPQKKGSDVSSSEESDNSSDEFIKEKEKPRRNSTSIRLKKYQEQKRLQKLEGANDFLNDVDSTEEVYLLQVPIKIDPKSLVGLNISLSDTIRIPELKKYESVPVLETQDSVSLFCNREDEHIRILKPMGSIKIQRHLKDKSVADMPKTHNDSVAFPHNLKERHPLFGSEFRKKIKLEENIKQKLDAAVATYAIKKKKKENKTKVATAEKPEEEIFKFLNESRACSDTTMESNVAEKSESKKKKKRRDLESQPADISANDSFKKTKKKDKEKHGSIEVDGKKRKNKDLDDSIGKKKPKFNSRNDNPLIQQLLSNETATLYKKKKKKRSKSENEHE